MAFNLQLFFQKILGDGCAGGILPHIYHLTGRKRICETLNRYIKSVLMVLVLVFVHTSAMATSYPYHLDGDGHHPAESINLIGFMQFHEVAEGETLLDVARNFGLGYNEIELSHPDIDPWVPGVGRRVAVPTLWLLPPTQHEEVVINIPEMRLYRFFKSIHMVKTYPIGIGREAFETPTTIARIVSCQEHPTWTPPPSAWDAYGKTPFPPGPKNPLGDYWIGLSADHIGIHGTNNPWGVGRQVSRGCIRLYPEHISQLFGEVSPGAVVEIVYEPVKIGIQNGLVYMEAHPDIYARIPDMAAHAEALIQQRGLGGAIDREKVKQCLFTQSGIPTVVGEIAKGGVDFVSIQHSMQ